MLNDLTKHEMKLLVMMCQELRSETKDKTLQDLARSIEDKIQQEILVRVMAS